jgi:hypothetical protein
MGLQTGSQLAVTKKAVIDPSNLKIVAYEVDGPLLNVKPSLIRIADVRELSNIGMIVDSSEEFIAVDDVISIEKIYKLNFNLVGLNVVDEAKHRLGKVINYSVDTSSFVVQQLNVRRGVLKSLADPELLVHRSQIIEITDTTITVRSTAQKIENTAKNQQLNYLNPFRQPTATVDNQKELG